MAWGILATQVPDTPAPSAWANQVKANFEAALGGDLSGTLPNPTITNGAVGTAKLADGAVTSPKLAAIVGPATALAVGTNPAQTGAVRLANNQFVYSRNASNSLDNNLIGMNASDQVIVGD